MCMVLYFFLFPLPMLFIL
uniref:Uncharacterized protein n=1 Tax=Rhizophora mucronata TaxID=61149 RepID=A0A2P2PDT1_RHIMU